MIKRLVKSKAAIIGLVVSILTPILIVGYEVIFRGKNSVTFTFDSAIGHLLVLYYAMLAALGVFLFFDWLISQVKIIRKLKNEKTKAELSHLKAQVNPHFFFNVLNNLYGWIDKDPSKAKELILRLSDMMRYSIYEGEKDKVLLTEEVVFLKNYIELNTVRYHKEIDVKFLVGIENEEVEIMPLMFIILVENAFKHGVEKLRDSAFVHVTLNSDEDKVCFEVINNFDSSIESKAGIGLRNLENRLNIVYPGKYELEENIEEEVYTAKLKLSIG